ncbi:alkaline phosphatase D family protein [Gloeobacter morelensis]|uniref:Alkaline phosphatase D family protein n=1 Tax=Gloeobacter morelensis MG652769 TaxID=2781736 RepID=A0ABY3PQC3_9CYAN|nr:alkaline phosphatase D family protein [Gloeobacter morelensis]UFP95897.1 alkaline phosphatase D family protein [Gloeobacter morelensis MG652769]
MLQGLAYSFLVAGVAARPTRAAVGLAAGPMPGCLRPDGVTLWLQGNAPAKLHVEYWDVLAPQKRMLSGEYALTAAEDYIAHLRIGGLGPSRRYAYRVLLDGIVQAISEPLLFRTSGASGTYAPFTMLAGSCAYTKDTPIFASMARLRPDGMLWLGDNVYFQRSALLITGEWATAQAMHNRYRQDRQAAALQPLLRSTHHWAVWDDHDYGPNDADSGYSLKRESLDLFQRFWDNPTYGLPDTPGVFTRFELNGVDFFLLDDRYHRTGEQMLGEKQLAWLKDGLLRSRGVFKVVAGGNQMFNDDNRFEGWNKFPSEREEFVRWLGASRIRGVVFLSGDRHFSELLRYERPGTYPLYELTCSPLTSKAYKEAQPARIAVPGTFVTEHNFASLDFGGSPKDARLRLRCWNALGQPLWEQVIRAADLQ